MRKHLRKKIILVLCGSVGVIHMTLLVLCGDNNKEEMMNLTDLQWIIAILIGLVFIPWLIYLAANKCQREWLEVVYYPEQEQKRKNRIERINKNYDKLKKEWWDTQLEKTAQKIL